MFNLHILVFVDLQEEIALEDVEHALCGYFVSDAAVAPGGEGRYTFMVDETICGNNPKFTFAAMLGELLIFLYIVLLLCAVGLERARVYTVLQPPLGKPLNTSDGCNNGRTKQLEVPRMGGVSKTVLTGGHPRHSRNVVVLSQALL